MTETDTVTYPNLRAWRAAKTLTQVAAAKKLGVSLRKYIRLEQRERFARGPEAKTIEKKTHVPLAVLVGASV